MSKPRQILPGRTYLITRRCADRRFFLRPDKATTRAFYYCLATAALKFEIGIVAFLASSNHWHGVVFDARGNLPDFLQYFHLLMAKHQNALRGRWENMWASEKTSVVELLGPEDIIDKVAYVLANPVKDHLVGTARSWPGASAIRALRGTGRITAKRPRRFFDQHGRLEPEASIALCKPPAFDHLTMAEFRDLVLKAVAVREAEAEAERKRRGIRVLGRAAVLRQSWNDKPKSRERRRSLSPRFACRDKRTRMERLAAYKNWVATYAEGRSRWARGEANVIFPAGTFWLKRHAGVLCEGDACPIPWSSPTPSSFCADALRS